MISFYFVAQPVVLVIGVAQKISFLSYLWYRESLSREAYLTGKVRMPELNALAVIGFCFFSSLLPILHSRERNCRGQWRPCPTLPSCSWAYWRREDVVSEEWLGWCEICKVWSTTFICRDFPRIDTGYIACFMSFNPCRIPDSLPYRGEK